jgi:hypothetical protein
MEITGTHGRSLPDAINLLSVGLLKFIQKRRFARSLALTMSQ